MVVTHSGWFHQRVGCFDNLGPLALQVDRANGHNFFKISDPESHLYQGDRLKSPLDHSGSIKILSVM